MKRRQGYRFKIEPKHKHFDHLNQSLGANRFVWNKLLSMNLYRLDNKLPLIWYNEMAWHIALWKKSHEYSFLNEAPSQSLQQTAKALDRAFKDAFDKNQPQKRIPVFKRLGQNEAGIKYPQGTILDQVNNVIRLPKLGWVKYRNSREVEGVVKNVTVSRKSGHYCVSIQTEREVELPCHPANTAIGIDMGVVRFATLSDGTVVEPKNSFKGLEEKLSKEQHKLSRKIKFSARWKSQKQKIARLHSTIAHVRNHFLHQLSHTISKNHAMIVIEDLKVSNMSKSARGTLEAPGQRVAQKSGLNKAILDQGWSEFRRQLEYKQEWRGGWLFAVPSHHTSQTCPKCYHATKENRVSQADFHCVACGYEDNADWVAAQNILQRGFEWLSQDKKQNRGAHGVRLPSEQLKLSATGTGSVPS